MRNERDALFAESLEQKRLRLETKERRAQIFFSQVMAEVSEWQATMLEAKGQHRQMMSRKESHKQRVHTSTMTALESDAFTTRFQFAVCKPIGSYARLALAAVNAFIKNVGLQENAGTNDMAFLGMIDFAGHGIHKAMLTEQFATVVSGLPAMPYVVFYPETPSQEYARVLALVVSARS